MSFSYPIGAPQIPSEYNAQLAQSQIEIITELPEKLHNLIDTLPSNWLDTPYRPDGWTGRQVVHHLADSHVNALVRCKFAATEDWPTIMPYLQGEWAKLADHELPVASSLSILEGLHHRWSTLLNNLSESDWTQRGYRHPEFDEPQPFFKIVAQYAWHCKHHLGHLRLLQ